jgi:hypothetical protein
VENAIMQKYTNQKNKQHKNTVIPMVFDYEISSLVIFIREKIMRKIYIPLKFQNLIKREMV